MFLFKVKIDDKNCVSTVFEKIYGIGKHKNKKIVAILGCKPFHKLVENKLEDRFLELELRLNEEISNIELELYRREYYNIKNLMDNGSFRGFCHKNGRPVRFQRTHTNAKTQSRLFKNRLELKK